MAYHTLHIPDADWEHSGPEEDPAGRRTAHILLNGIRFHLEAFRVRVDDERIQVADTPSEEVRAWFSDYSAASSEQSSPFETIELDGEDYAVFGTV